MPVTGSKLVLQLKKVFFVVNTLSFLISQAKEIRKHESQKVEKEQTEE